MHMRSRSQYTSNKRVLFCYEVVREIGEKKCTVKGLQMKCFV